MKIYQDITEVAGLVEKPVVTMGTFDGVHVGHRKILQQLIKSAKKEGGESVVITFDPHPRLVLGMDAGKLKFINTRKERTVLLDKLGIDHLIIIPFTKVFSTLSSRNFILKVLVQCMKIHKIIIGYDHHFGRDREGNFELLAEMGKKHQFIVEEIPAQLVNDIAVSSTKIRKALASGNISKANELLGYDFPMEGKVIQGRGIGRKLGFPTANIQIIDPHKLIPVNGVYAVWAFLKGKTYPGMLNIGYRPTFNDRKESIEVHIIDFEGYIYNEELKISFIKKIREAKKFSSPDALKKQLIEDREEVRHLLKYPAE